MSPHEHQVFEGVSVDLIAYLTGETEEQRVVLVRFGTIVYLVSFMAVCAQQTKYVHSHKPLLLGTIAMLISLI
jgi:hypothetical protein